MTVETHVVTTVFVVFCFAFVCVLRATNAMAEQQDEAAKTREASRITGLTWVAQKKGTVFSGHLPVPLPSISYQVDGCRFFCSIYANELLSMMMKDGLCPQSINPTDAPRVLEDTGSLVIAWVGGLGIKIKCQVLIFEFKFKF